QRGEADDRPDHEGDEGRHRHGGEKAPAVVFHQDRGRVRPEPEEGAVTDRHLPVVAGQEVEAHGRDREVDGLGEELGLRRTVLLRQVQDDRGRDRTDRKLRDAHTVTPPGSAHHTRSTTRRPKSPVGRNSNTSRMMPKGTRISMSSSRSTYWIVSAFAIPTT